MFPRHNQRQGEALHRAGLTLVELLLAMSITAIMAGTLSVLASAVYQGTAHIESQGTATQHARVVLDRIERLVSEATATPEYPGVVVVHETVGAWRFPDMLVLWHPNAAPANPAGPPLVEELILVCPDPLRPRALIEVTVPGDNRPVAFDEVSLNSAAWRAELERLAADPSSQRVLLTELLRTNSVDNLSDRSDLRGAVRFECVLSPSASQWTAWQAGTLSWDQLSWAQGVYGSQAGLRQAWLRTELQLVGHGEPNTLDRDGQDTTPFLGSGVLFYEMRP